MKYIYCLIVVCCLAAPTLSLSQTESRAPHLGIGWTGLLYTGDLTVNESDFLRVYPGSNIYLQFANQKAFRLRFSAGFGKIVEQTDRKVQTFEEARQPNDYFETNLFYFDLRLMRYFFREGPIQPYLGFGPSVFSFNPKDQAGNFLIDNIFTRAEGEEFATTTIVWPATAGLSFPISQNLRINADYTYRLNMSDYIDNIGLLGSSPGRDQLHAFQVSFDISLGIKRKTREPKIRIEEELPLKPIVVVSHTPKSTLSSKRTMKYRKLDSVHHDHTDWGNKLEIDHLLHYEMPKQVSLSSPEVYSPSLTASPNQGLEEYQWAKLQNFVEERDLYKKVKSIGNLSQLALAQMNHLSLADFQKLNPELPEPVPYGHQLLVPDWEAAIKAIDP